MAGWAHGSARRPESYPPVQPVTQQGGTCVAVSQHATQRGVFLGVLTDLMGQRHRHHRVT